MSWPQTNIVTLIIVIWYIAFLVKSCSTHSPSCYLKKSVKPPMSMLLNFFVIDVREK